MSNIRVRLIIEGRVQGVWFRDSTRRMAKSLGVTGWVRNLPDGNVEAVAEGPEEQVQKLVEWCHQGPPHARVTHVQQFQEQWKGQFHDFEIKF